MVAKRIFMVRPACFGFNPETSQTNVFQQKKNFRTETLQSKVLDEFDGFVDMLRKVSIEVDVLLDDPLEKRLDAVFSNNWISTHPGQIIVTYPMLSPIRRKERDCTHIRYIINNYQVHSHISLEHYERNHLFLEGTGSLIIDHKYGIVYASRSPRTHEIPLLRFCRLMGFTPVLFNAVDKNGTPVYHTNVVMGIGMGYVIINNSAISARDWDRLAYYFKYTEKEVIEISHEQMAAFAANIAYINNMEGIPFIAMSDTAYGALKTAQKRSLSRYGSILHSGIPTLEQIGGGSAKCIITENYLKPWN